MKILEQYSEDDYLELCAQADMNGMESLTEEQQYVLANYKSYLEVTENSNAKSAELCTVDEYIELCNRSDYYGFDALTDEEQYILLNYGKRDDTVLEVKLDDDDISAVSQKLNSTIRNIGVYALAIAALYSAMRGFKNFTILCALLCIALGIITILMNTKDKYS